MLPGCSPVEAGQFKLGWRLTDNVEGLRTAVPQQRVLFCTGGRETWNCAVGGSLSWAGVGGRGQERAWYARRRASEAQSSHLSARWVRRKGTCSLFWPCCVSATARYAWPPGAMRRSGDAEWTWIGPGWGVAPGALTQAIDEVGASHHLQRDAQHKQSELPEQCSTQARYSPSFFWSWSLSAAAHPLSTPAIASAYTASRRPLPLFHSARLCMSTADAS